MSAVTHSFDAVTDATWTDEVLKSEVPVLVDFWADWCGPCHRLRPTLEALAEEWTGRVRVVALDIDANPNTARDYGILSAPTLILFRGGEPVRTVVGAQPKARLAAQLEPAL
ncbi:thioredoxin [Cryptosporangium aurantiacum]|uniref:Thioredoxin n=1 Tax=Cryptosporangium aurantiacum TaxID=134849 RepID=A0A1M7NQ83_9ACTN|nr:thioredoxin [Cryptosporangium aurantiacum]SHN05941.1 thioredoxin [Cryptosporangium aurantiacum]